MSSEDPGAVRPVLERWAPRGSVTVGGEPAELVLEAAVTGTSARALNRALLSELRRAERRTRLRSEWTCDGVTERFFDYVPKGTRTASP